VLAIALALAAGACAGGGDGPASTSSTGSAMRLATARVVNATDGAQTLQKAFVDVVRAVSPSVVQIATSQGLGSGVVLDTRGHIVTNAHVVGSAHRFVVTLASGSRRSATLVASYPPNDVAVIDAAGSGFHPAVLGDSTRLQVGDIVLAMGNPLGLRSSVTEGIVSALGRTLTEPNGAALPNLIQTSAAINPGNSGGALVDLAGHVVGMPTLAANDPEMGGAAPGIGFAIGSHELRDLASQMIAHGKVVDSHRAFLGVQLADTQAGPVVVAVAKNGPASRSRIRPGDVILKIDGQATPSAASVAALLAQQRPGSRVDVVVRTQNGATRTVHVRLGKLPAR
jgi:putative serine protease PepD